jgi:thiol-disulfide isomerase/thioredoxin
MQIMKLIRLFIIIFLIGIFPVISEAQENIDVKTLEIGEPAPDFNLPGVDDKNYSLKDFNQYPYLVILFTCNHCPTAQAYEDKIITLVNDYRKSGVGFVGIMPNSAKALSLAELGYSDMGDDLSDMKIRSKEKGFNFPYLFDGADQKVSIRFGPIATPHVFVFDKDRKLRYSGRIDDTENPYIPPVTEDLKIALNALLQQKPVPVEKTKTFGCSIKWAWKDHWKNELINEWAKEPVTIDSINSEGIRSLITGNTKNLRLINVWATWCGPCVVEFPELIKINRMYRGRDFELVTISADKPGKKDKVLEFLNKNQASSKNYIFSSNDKYALIEAVDKDWQGSLPYTILVAPEGKIIFRVPEAFDPLILKKQIVHFLGRYYADDK